MSLAAVLLCLILLSAHYTTGMYARYTTRAYGNDKAREASFQVSAEGQTSPVEIGTDGKGTFSVTIHNDSDVAVRYVAKVVSSDSKADEVLQNITIPSDVLQPHTVSAPVEIHMDMMNYDGNLTDIPFDVIVTFTQID